MIVGNEECWAQVICWECSLPLRGVEPIACPRCDAPICPSCALDLVDAQNAPDAPTERMTLVCSSCLE